MYTGITLAKPLMR